MDGAGDALGSRALTILPADLAERANRNRNGAGHPVDVPQPGTPAPATAAAPAPPPAPRAPAPRPARPASAAPPAPAQPNEPTNEPTAHVLRLANDVRTLTYALAYVQKQLTEAVDACAKEAKARQAAEAELAEARLAERADHATARAAAQAEFASARAAIQAELADARSDAHRLQADVQRLTAETEQLRRALAGAHRQADQWSEKAGSAELRLKAALLAADRAADDRNELEQALAERDAAHRRVGELEAELQRARTPHPRGMTTFPTAGLSADPTAPSPATGTAATTAGPSNDPLLQAQHLRGAGVVTEVHEEHPVALANEIQLDPWQEDALAAWSEAGHRGVVESVTTDGNMRLAFWAIGRALDNNMKALVLTPSAERVDLWFDRLRDVLPINRVGKHVGRGSARLAAYDVVVATAQAATKEHLIEPGLGALVVADEVHEFGTPVLIKALNDSYMWRLGLTSCYERDDDGVAMYLDRYFGGPVFRLGYDRAISEQVIASFDLAMVPVRLSDAEQTEHDACAAATLAGGSSGGGKAAVRAYLKAVTRRDEILAGTTARDSMLRSLAAVIRNAGQALVIAPSTPVAAHVDRILVGQGCVTIPARMGDGEARNRRGGKSEEERDVWLLAGPRGWDQPQDTRDVELAIVVSPPRTRRQLIERLDRVLGGKPAGFHVRLVILYVEGSIEDDTVSEEARSIVGVRPTAKRSKRFTTGDTDGLYEFLVAGRRIVTLPPDPAIARLAASVPNPDASAE